MTHMHLYGSRSPGVVRILAAFCVLGVMAAGICCGRRGHSTSSTMPADRTRRTEFVRRHVLTGELLAVRSANVAVPELPEWRAPVRWLEKDGTAVKAGQKVAEIDAVSASGSLDQKRLAVTKARTALEQKSAEVARTLAEKRFRLEQQRVAMRKAEMEASVPEALVSRQKHRELQLAFDRARIEHEKAVEDLSATERSTAAEIEEAKMALGNAEAERIDSEKAIETMALRAPCDGLLIVSDHPWEGRKIEVGDAVWIGLSIAQIPDLSEMRVEAALSDMDDGDILSGMPAICTMDMYPDTGFTGSVTEITPVAQEPASGSTRRAFRVRVSLDRSDPERMRPGMSVKVVVEIERIKDALLAARGSIDFGSTPPQLRLNGGKRIDIVLGPCNAQDCVIVSGAVEGQELDAAR